MESNQLETSDDFVGLEALTDKALSDKIPLNPLVQAANCFFVASKDPDTESLDKTQEHLLEKLDTFQTILSHYYADALVLVSTYVLCFTLDSLITARLGKYHELWAKHSLVEFMFQYDTEDGLARLLDSVDFIFLSEEADTQLFEYVYLCLSLSVKNKTELSTELTEKFNGIMDKLYKKIYDAKDGFTTKMGVEQALPINETSEKKSMPIWLTLTLTAVLLFTVYSVVNFFYSHASNKTLTSLNSLVTQPQNHNENHSTTTPTL
jgi:type IV/VI secretion system ImpK/VasF family protein